MLPSDLSGVINVCPGAGNCKKTCLHFAGNPAYMKGKNAKRLRQTLAFADDQNLYLETLFLAICRAIYKHQARELHLGLMQLRTLCGRMLNLICRLMLLILH